MILIQKALGVLALLRTSYELTVRPVIQDLKSYLTGTDLDTEMLSQYDMVQLVIYGTENEILAEKVIPDPSLYPETLYSLRLEILQEGTPTTYALYDSDGYLIEHNEFESGSAFEELTLH